VELGTENPRLNVYGHVDPRLSAQIAQWKQEDPPPSRVKPIPISVLHHVYTAAQASGMIERIALADMIYIAFFYLNRPGEYTAAAEGSRPFRYCDAALFIGRRRLDKDTASEAELMASTFSALTYTMQKNCVPGEVIGQGCSGSITACATKAIARRVLHLREHNAPPDVPLCCFWQHGRWYTITSAMVTDALRQSVAVLGPSIGLLPEDVSSKSLRAGGAMAMLCAGIDPNRTQLLGRWRSDAMLRYLHVQAYPLISDIAPKMLAGGVYTLLPGPNVTAALSALESAVAADTSAATSNAAAAAATAANPTA